MRASSIGAVIAGLNSVKDIVYVNAQSIINGYRTLYNLLPNETPTREDDLFLLTLIYPYNLLDKPLAQLIIKKVEDNLLRERGVLRYKGDSYYSTLEQDYGRGKPLEFYRGTEAEWTFGFSFLALAHMELGNYEKAAEYIEKVEGVMLEDGSLPELYFAGIDLYNGNTPLGWSNSMFILAKGKYIGS